MNNSTCWGFSFDETPDRSKIEQISLILRFVSDDYEIREVFFGLYDAYNLTDSESLNASTLSTVIIKILESSGLDLTKMVSVCTDGANLMSGKDSGCIKLLKGRFPNLLYSICLSHTLNLSISAAMKNGPMASAFESLEKVT